MITDNIFNGTNFDNMYNMLKTEQSHKYIKNASVSKLRAIFNAKMDDDKSSSHVEY